MTTGLIEKAIAAMDDDTNELFHYGVKGMKWGVRKDRQTDQVTLTSEKTGDQVHVKYDPNRIKVGAMNPDTRGVSVQGRKKDVRKFLEEMGVAQKTLERKEAMSEDARKAMEVKAKPPSQMSNAEMRTLIDRVRLEQDYHRTVVLPTVAAAQRPKGKSAATRKFVGDLVSEIAKEQTKRVAKTVATQQTNKLAKRAGLNLVQDKKKKKD